MLGSDEPEKSQKDVSGADQESQDNHMEVLGEPDADSPQDDKPDAAVIKQDADSESALQELPEGQEQELIDDDSIPDWLRPEFSEEGVEDPVGDEVGSIDAVTDTGHRTMTANEEILTESESSVSEKTTATNGTEELGWLEQIASGEGASLEESPTMSWDDPTEPERSSEVDENEMTWLEEIDTEQSIPVVTDINIENSDDGDSIEQTADVISADTIHLEDDPLGEVPDDPDEVMAWLENLAARQGADPEELPTYSVDSSASEPVQSDEIPEDPDEAMAWLEQLSALELSTPDDSTMVVELDSADELDDLMAESPITESFDEVPPDSGGDEMSDDLNEALIWLEEIVELPPSKDKTDSVAEESEDVIMPVSTVSVVRDAEPSDEIEDEDVEQAMEWLEQLAARQGAAPEELSSVVDADAEAQLPDWLEAQREDFQPEELAALAISDAVEGFEEDGELEIPAAEEPIAMDEIVTSEGEEILSIDEQVIESLSQVAPEIVTEPVANEDMDWLETLGGVDAEGWLDSEAGATVVSEDSQISQIDSGILISKEFAAETEQQKNIEVVEDIIQEIGELDGELLDAAHSAVNAGDYLQAVEEYTILLEQEVDLDKLILDLESSSESSRHEPVMQRLLGDVYAKNGQTQKALEVYREALDNL